MGMERKLKTRPSRVRGLVNQILVVALINVPTVSFGLTLGWISLATGEGGDNEEDGGEMVAAACVTFGAAFLGVPLSARAVASGRKVAVIATSLALMVCWSLKLMSEGWWWLMAARAAAGLAGAGAWIVSPLLAREMCEPRIRGAAVAALILAHNLGMLLMYIAADALLPHRTVLWWCLGLSACHCVAFLFVPESPAYLAACGRTEEARSSLAWLRGLARDDPALQNEFAALPVPEKAVLSPYALTKELLSDRQRRRAFIISSIAVVGQEMCGVLALLQYAERVFVLARDQLFSTEGKLALGTPARHAVMLGAVQLIASAISLYLVEKIGRRPLMISTSITTGVCLGVAGAAVAWGAGAGGEVLAAVALAIAVAADSGGLQPAPYALLGDMFTYRYRGCVLMLATAMACIGNGLEVGVFPVIASRAGLPVALAGASILTLSYSIFAIATVPETRHRNLKDIYNEIYPLKDPASKDTVCTNI